MILRVLGCLGLAAVVIAVGLAALLASVIGPMSDGDGGVLSMSQAADQIACTVAIPAVQAAEPDPIAGGAAAGEFMNGDDRAQERAVVAQEAVKHWSPEEAVTAVAVAEAESGLNPTAANPNSTARGLWQLMLSYHLPKFRPGERWQDPAANARVAHIVWKQGPSGQGPPTWTPTWSVYTSGAYRQYLPKARAAVEAALDGAPVYATVETVCDSAPMTAAYSAGLGAASVAGYPLLPNGLGPNADAGRRLITAEFGVPVEVYHCLATEGHVEDSYHYTGHACDVMIGERADLGAEIRDWARANAAEMGIVEIIHASQIWTAERTSEGWRPYTGDNPHTGHVHLSFDRSREPAVQTVATSTGLPDLQAMGGVFTAPVTSEFGMRVHPETGEYKLHDGTDFGAACGTPVPAVATGIVTESSMQSGWGNRVYLEHGLFGERAIASSYNHLESMAVSVNERVVAGQIVGYVGTTGSSTGCHLHYSTYIDGTAVDPLR